MKRALLALLVVAGCKKSSSEATPDGYVIRVHLEKRLSPSDVGGIEVVLSKDSGFPAFSERMAGEIRVESRDTNGDSANEVVLTWPADFDYAETQFVRLRFDNQAAFAMAIAGSATDASGGTLANGSESVTVPAGGEGVADVTLACAAKGCVPVVPDAGADEGQPDDAGPDAVVTPEPQPDVPPDQLADAGVMPEPPPDLSIADTTLTQVGETASAAGTSGAGTLVLQHQVGHMIGNGSSSGGAGPTTVESVLTITR